MKKTLFLAGMAAVVLLAACSKQTAQDEKIYSIDEVYSQAEALVGDTISLEGICAHLCKHGGRKAFLMGNESDTLYTENDTIIRPRILRVEGAKMGNFDAACINNLVRVRGVVQAFEYVPEPVETPAEKHGEGNQGCATEQQAIRGYYAEAISYEIINTEK